MDRRGRRALVWGALLAAAVVAGQLVAPEMALARGGGGGHGGGGGIGGGGGLGGGGGFGGGGFGGGGGGGFVAGAGLGALGGGGLAVAVVVIVILYILFRYFGGGRSAPPEESEAYPAQAPPEYAGAAAGLTAIDQADPGFDPETFLQRAEMAFFLVQRAYQDRNPSMGRAFLSAALWQQWAAGIQRVVENRQRPVLENLNVRGMQITGAAHGPDGDSIGVHFDFVAAVHFDDEATGRMVAGTSEDQRYGEEWAFWRAPGAVTPAGGGATYSRCPSCGAPLLLNDDGRCDHCGEDVAAGARDWVITSIRRTEFLAVSTARGLGIDEMEPGSGLAALRADDPTFDPNAFLGRAQQAFFALQQAWQDRDLTASRPFMSPGLYLGWSAQVQQLIELHKKNVLEGLRIDRLTFVKVGRGRIYDELTVRVTATCADYEIDERTGRMIFGSRSPGQFSEEWTFQRGRGTQTSGRSILDKVCPNCGAPLDINQFGECRYCNAAVTSGRFDWVLSRIEEED